MSASIHADLRMIPHASALFSRGCKLTSLWGRPISGHCEDVCTSEHFVYPKDIDIYRGYRLMLLCVLAS